MKLLVLDFIDKENPQLLRRMNAKFSALRDQLPHGRCYVIGDGKPEHMHGYDFTYVHATDIEDKIACCYNLSESLRPDLVYMRYPGACEPLLRYVSTFPNVVFEHNSIEEKECTGTARDLELALGPQIISAAAGVVGVTREIAEYERERSRPDMPIFVLPNSLEVSGKKIEKRPQLSPGGTLRMFSAGRFDQRHGLERVFNGLASNAAKERFELHLVGEGPELENYKKLHNDLNLQKHVHFYGRISEEKLRELEAHCHIGVGSLGLYKTGLNETCSLKVREYASKGLPFFFSGVDSDFFPESPFAHMTPNDDSPIDLDGVYDFALRCLADQDAGAKLCKFADDHLTWKSRSEEWGEFLRSVAATAAAKITSPPPGPLFSIVIPCYNQAHFLAEAVASVHDQNFQDLEVIIINDGSPDNTSEVARQLVATYPDMVIRLIEQENMGLSEARNSGVREAKAPWIQCLDSDDKLAEGVLAAAAAIIDDTPQISALSGMLREFGARDSDWRYVLYVKGSLSFSNSLPASVIFRRSLWEAVGGYDPSNPWGLEDWHFWLKSMAFGWLPLPLSIPHYWYRIHNKTSMLDKVKEYWDEVLALHQTMFGDIYNSATVLAAHTVLLNMSDVNQQMIKAKCERFPELPMPWFWLGLYHEGRGEKEAALACYLRAQRLEDAAISRPGGPDLQWQIHYRLYGLFLSMNFFKKAQSARDACERLKPELKAPLAEQDRIIALATSSSGAGKRILLMGEFFWPSLGGIETFLEHLGDYLLQNGYEVHVATSTRSNRKSLEHRGMRIHEFPHYMNLQSGLLGGLDDFDCLLRQCGFSHVICLSHIDPWSMYLCAMSQPKPKVIFLPLLQNYKDFIKDQSLAEMVQLIGQASHVCRIMEGSLDRQLLELAGIKSHFVPHMVPALESGFQFRKSFGLSADIPLFLNVANFWPFKNHLGLIKTLKVLQGDWRLVMIGSPHDSRCLAQVKKAIDGDSRFILLEQQPRDVTAAAIREADTVLLGSWYEGCPLTILEAMSIGTTWLATPECGSVVDQAGGFVADLELFPLLLTEIINDESVKAALGQLGKRHWEACFSPEAVLPAFIELLENDGAHMPDLRMPAQLRAENATLCSAVKDRIAFNYGIFL